MVKHAKKLFPCLRMLPLSAQVLCAAEEVRYLAKENLHKLPQGNELTVIRYRLCPVGMQLDISVFRQSYNYLLAVTTITGARQMSAFWTRFCY